MTINEIVVKIIIRVHRKLLESKCYRQAAFRFGWDSFTRKKYYRYMHFGAPDTTEYSEVDGYHGEGDFRKIELLVGNLLKTIPAPRSVLDIGCGTGRYLKQISRLLPDCYLEGIDISPEIVEKFTKKQVPNAVVHVLDIEADKDYHIDNRGKFDLVCMIGLIQILSLAKIRTILQKVNTLCSGGGFLYLQFNVETDEKKSDIGYKRYSIAELTELLKQAGFHVIKSETTDILEDYAYIIAESTAEL